VRGTLGAGGTRGAARLLAEGGMVNQLGVADAFVRAAAEIDGSTTAGAFGLGARAFVDAYRFTADTQVAAELSVRATAGVAVAGGTVGVSAEQFERLVWGAAPVGDLRTAPARTTGVSAAYDAPSPGPGPSLRRVAYTYTYDWRANRASAHVASVTAALRVGTADVTPTLSYDVVRDRAALSTDVTLYSDCFAYGGTVEVSAERGVFGVSARLKFGLR
jgi:hypothetical protein